ncbi:ANK-REP-REGION domain-containing protein [Aphelenchoides besseyi]|nr:ANK-REP-REGION domain-containing protein [Aphelenchoides besseyi]KAI6226976.1 ANK-REP-REGION domain-containing protein [Aphelenchoides besseyi]
MEHDAVENTTNQIEEMECDDRLSDTLGDADDLDDEKRDEVGSMPTELWEKIRDQKKTAPSMFVSGWEEDEQGIEPGDASDPNEQFLRAAENGDLNTLKLMFARNPDLLTARDRDLYTPLHRAAYNNHVEAAKWLLSVGADPELRTEEGWTVLHSAACWAAHDMVGLLLSRGVEVNSRSNGNLTPLHLAINSCADPKNQIITLKYLLSAPGIDMSAVNKAGETPIMLAKRASPQVYEVLEHFLRRP